MGDPPRKRRLPWGTLLLGVVLLGVAIAALILIPATTLGPRSELVPTPGQISLPPTPTPILPGPAVTVTATPRVHTTATPGH